MLLNGFELGCSGRGHACATLISNGRNRTSSSKHSFSQLRYWSTTQIQQVVVLLWHGKQCRTRLRTVSIASTPGRDQLTAYYKFIGGLYDLSRSWEAFVLSTGARASRPYDNHALHPSLGQLLLYVFSAQDWYLKGRLILSFFTCRITQPNYSSCAFAWTVHGLFCFANTRNNGTIRASFNAAATERFDLSGWPTCSGSFFFNSFLKRNNIDKIHYEPSSYIS